MNLLQAKLLEKRVLLADGATGSVLREAAKGAGLAGGAPSELVTLERPDLVLDLHRRYIRAGSELILTNTFGATRLLLGRWGLADRFLEVNRVSAQLAREAAGRQVVVLGNLGPTGDSMAPQGDLTTDQARAVYRDQAEALTQDDAVDALLIETMSDLSETSAAIEGARAATRLPILVTMSFGADGRTATGVDPASAAKRLWDLGVEIIGANCGGSISDSLIVIRTMKEALPDAILLAKPNAGEPASADRAQDHGVSPRRFGQAALQFFEEGVRIFGGCCGTNPDHIRAARDALARRRKRNLV